MDENGHEIAFGWDRFGLSSRLTAAGQLTSAKRGADGLVAEVSASVTGRVDRTVRREHDSHGRVTRVTYAKGETETFAYDRWGRLSEHARGSLKETYRYDHFGRLVERDENGTVFSYAYDAYGRRTSRTIRFADGGAAQEERRSYDRYGRLVEITAFGTSVKWRYDDRGRVARQVVDGSPIDFAYTKDGRLAGKWLGGRESPDASVEYEYSKDGRIVARTANGVRQAFAYDARGQLVAVKENGVDVERYAYDRAGNMVRKTVRGRTTTYTFDGANQFVSSTCDGVTTRYAYDAAGRLVREGNRTYRYGYLDKVLSVTDGKRSYRYAYHVDGQLARADYGDGGRVGVGDGGRAGSPLPAASEDFHWDGLALVRRGDESFVNEPHVGGGNPVVSSKGAAYFNDALGTTVGVREGRGAAGKRAKRRYTAAALTAFGEPLQTQKGETSALLPSSFLPLPLFFTGKPQVEGLGYAFLYRNYRSDLAKWQTADPLGYPDGWNQLAYCGNEVTRFVDYCGGRRESGDTTWAWEYRNQFQNIWTGWAKILTANRLHVDIDYHVQVSPNHTPVIYIDKVDPKITENTSLSWNLGFDVPVTYKGTTLTNVSVSTGFSYRVKETRGEQIWTSDDDYNYVSQTLYFEVISYNYINVLGYQREFFYNSEASLEITLRGKCAKE